MTYRFRDITPLLWMVKAGTETTITLPGPTNQPTAPEGLQIVVVDDMGLAGTNNISILGPIAGGTSGTSISTNYGSAWFMWMGNTYTQK
jgi:hypothetical protein